MSPTQTTRCPGCCSDNVSPRNFGQACGDCGNYWITPEQQIAQTRAAKLHCQKGGAAHA